ncbi:MBL fold metallo-hydrolase [Dyadobacter sp. CY312]|uniref:MBL fold metallo-hydrolase n=1 Tax=Dyadobacter sp. CY312 TaxID=2907303 RepID=UPI001F44A0E7|nr:MBL fold metallo-hydrolase [Dyadobacter sp. CY312]MCE7039573.1 MBL fold metallo-hydrolase [Dyadobacter sp. CY312]
MPFTSNPELPYVNLPFEWQGTPVTEKGRFVNHELPFNESLIELLKWQTQRNPQKAEKQNDLWRLNVPESCDFLNTQEDVIVWLGHASFFIRLSGISILIDPVFVNNPFLRRLCPLPVPIESFKNLDYILISHDHRDHCDEKTIRLLAANNPNTTWLTGLNMTKLLSGFTKSSKIQTAGWYQQYETDPKLKITYVPSRHWGKRGLGDTNLRLWGGFVIQCAGKTIYFCGDSGYGSHFADAAKVFPDIDYCLVGIGAYKPEFFMGQSHTSPADAFRAFLDTKAKMMIPMHYGTFDLADEPIGDPIRVLKQLDHTKGKIKYPDVGVSFL